MQPNSMTSPETVVPENVAVVLVLAVFVMMSAGVVLSLAKQDQPVGAVTPTPPFSVTTTVQAPVVPDLKVPAVPEPASVLTEQPDAVNFVPVVTAD